MFPPSHSTQTQHVINSTQEGIVNLLNKEHVPDSTLFHAVCSAWFSEADMKDVSEVISLIRDTVIRMAHTRDGSRVAVRCAELGTAKDRKSMLKSMKGFVPDTFRDQYGHLFAMALLDRTDDTTLLNSAIIQPITSGDSPALNDLICHPYGHLPILHILSPFNPKYFSQETIHLLSPDEGEASTSRKPSDQRRTEILTALSEPLVRACTSRAGDLLGSVHGCRVLIETVSGCGSSSEDLFSAISSTAVEGGEEGPAGSPHGSRALQRMNPVWPALAKSLCQEVEGGAKLEEWAKSKHLSFVIARIAAAKEECSAQMVEKLKEISEQLQEIAGEQPGVQLILDAL